MYEELDKIGGHCNKPLGYQSLRMSDYPSAIDLEWDSDTKECSICERDLPATLEYYHRRGDGSNTPRYRCKECRGSSFGIHNPNQVLEIDDGRKVCTGCFRSLPADIEYFHKTEKTSSGFTSKCKECRGDGTSFGIHKPNRSLDLPSGQWYCVSCEEVYERTEENFYPCGFSDGFERLCKDCSSLRKNQLRRKNRLKVECELSFEGWEEIKDKWDGCAYCGCSEERLSREHIIPMSKGGDTVYSNIIPSCRSCNSSKGDKKVENWYPKQDFFQQDRWEKICEHRGKQQTTATVERSG